MRVKLILDEHLIKEAQALGGHQSKSATITAVLQEYVKRRKQAEIIKLFGTIDFDPAWEYKADRRRGQRTRKSPAR